MRAYNGLFSALTGHVVQSAILDDIKAWRPPLGHQKTKERKVKLDRLEFLCVQVYYTLLSPSMVDFVPCVQLMQKTHLSSWKIYIVFLHRKLKMCTSPTAGPFLSLGTTTQCFLCIPLTSYKSTSAAGLALVSLRFKEHGGFLMQLLPLILKPK